MRILFLAQELPYPPHGGGAVRHWSLLRALGGEHHLKLACFGDPEMPISPPLTDLCRGIEVVRSPVHPSRLRRGLSYLAGLGSPRPWMVREWWSRAMWRLVAELSTDVDLVVAEHLAMAQYLAACPRARTCYDANNVESSILEQTARSGKSWIRRGHAAREARKVRRYEARLLCDVDRVLAVTEADCRDFRELVPEAVVRTVPISIATTDYPDLWRSGKVRLCFFGDMGWLPNVEAALHLCSAVLPLLERELGFLPEVVLAGKRPLPAVRALAGPRVQVTGFVPKMEEVLSGDTIVVVPLLTGGGMRVKILEAMAWGLPVVTTSLGCAGIDHDGALVEVNGPAALALAVAGLLEDRDLRRALGRAGRQRVRDFYDYRGVGKKFVEAVLGLD